MKSEGPEDMAVREFEERRRVEDDMSDRGVPVSLKSTAAWAEAFEEDSSLVVGTDGGGRPAAAGAVSEHASRALPGHRILRMERFRPEWNRAAALDALERAVALARAPRILRLHVEVFGLNPDAKASLEGELADFGFSRASRARCYARTMMIDLTPSEDELFAGIHATARRHVRAVDKKGLALRTITDPALAPRLAELLQETMERTGGTPMPFDWPAAIRLSAGSPARSRIIGLFHGDVDGPEGLLAFAWGLHNGDHVEYSTAATTRDTDLSIGLGYGPAWDLIVWAKQAGAAWFDFGGITAGSADDPDPLGGISDFKRRFEGTVAEVGSEWIYQARPLRSRLATLIGRGARLLRK